MFRNLALEELISLNLVNIPVVQHKSAIVLLHDSAVHTLYCQDYICAYGAAQMAKFLMSFIYFFFYRTVLSGLYTP